MTENTEEKKTFKDFGLSENALKAINKKGFEEPTPIQILTIPLMMRDDVNIIAQAQTGTGKTAAFGLPLIEMVKEDLRKVQALILTPTRELAIQVAEEINSLKGSKDIRVVPIYGGQSIDQQLRSLKKGVHIVVGTPGRVIDHLNRKTLNVAKIEHLILDEADEMLNMGFIEDMEEIMKHTNPAKRTLLFSATIPAKIRALANKYMDGHELLTVKKENLITNLTEQIYFEVKAHDKFEALCRIIDIEDDFYALVFCRTKSDVDGVAAHLKDRGYDAVAIHGDISQAQRERTLGQFKNKKVNILVATDVAARGIDVSDLTHVINYSLPQDPESYVHRIGRTGRAGKQGTAITFITPSEYNRLMFIQRFAKTDIKKARIPNVDDIINAKKKKIHDDLALVLGEEIGASYYDWAAKLIGENEPVKILAAVLSYCFEEELSPDSYGKIKDSPSKGKQLDQHGKVRLFVALGKKDNIDARKLVELIMRKVSIKSQHIRDIQILEKFSFMSVPFENAEEIIAGFKKQGQKPLIAHVKNKK
ncbi:MAG: DEAD/DEAH box helicase [Candidatus Omnitrophota bacterium]|nr:DEAD/DEAH box helicase [Candidatus Omnitrophota bacterium]MBU2528069.1 DEAD/DEAH box helicase [bacterium]MBU3929756.1 DEAD/DEAH box helicase [bacterium]MBU4123220.1 DEAD/DEAH box helicase [bacterium]